MYVYKQLNTIESRLLTFGDPFARESEVIIVITGGPGIPEFYREFAEQLHCNTQLPVCVVGHAGQDIFKNFDEHKKDNTRLWDLDFQIEHKLDLLSSHIDKSSRLHVIGHSIGAWLLLELLKKNDHLIERISSVNLLFPTLQKFSETPNGKFVNNTVRRLPGLVLLICLIAHWVPEFIRFIIIKLCIKINAWPSHYVKRLNLYLLPIVQKNTIELSFKCLEIIKDLNVSAINRVKHLTNVVYSPDDGWVPMHHIEDLKKYTPHLTLEEVSVDHAFVLKSSILVANIVAKLIQDKMKG